MDFDTLVTKVLRREGGYVNNPADRGGETNFGISQRANPDIDVKNLTEAQARQIYFERYWKPLGGDSLPENVRDLAFDTAVHHGVGTARAWLRETNNDPRALLERRRAALQKQGRRADQRQFLNGWMNRLAEFDVQPDSSPAPTPQVRQTARAAVLAAAAGRPTGTIAAPAVAPPSPVAEAPEAPAMRGPLSAVEQQALVDVNRPRIDAALEAASFDQRLRVGAQPSTLERYGAAVSGNTDNRLIRALIGMSKPEFPADPNWQVPWDKVNSYPRDVAVDLANSKSQAEFDAKLADIAEEEERTRAIMSGGTVSGIALMFAGEATSLSAYLAPAAALRAASGRIALAAAAGHRAQAIGIGAAAGGAADLGLELTLQALEGEADAKSAVLTGTLGVMFGGLDAALITRGLQRLQPQIDQAAQERGVKIATAIDKLGDGATPQQILDEVKRAEVEEIKQPLTEALTSVRDDRKFFDNPDDADETPDVPDDSPAEPPASPPAATRTAAPKLPRELAGAKPRYSYGNKQFQLEFESDVEKAFFIIAQKKPSKRDSEYVAWLSAQYPNATVDELRAVGRTLANAIKLTAKDSEPGVLKVPSAESVLRQGPAPEPVPVRQAIEQALNSPALRVANETSRATRHLLTHLQKILPQQVLDAVPVSFDGNVRGGFNSITRSISAPGQSGSTLRAVGAGNHNDANVLAHEVVHAATDRVIIAVLDGVEGVSEGSVRAVQRLDQIRQELDAHLAAKGIRQRGRQTGADYAASDLLEFVAQVMNDVETRKALSEMPGGEFKNMLSAFADAVVRLLGLDPKTNDSALREAVALVEKIIKEGENPPGLTAANFIRSRPGLSGPSSPRFASEAGDVLDTERVTSLEPGKTHVLFRGGPKGQAEAPKVPDGLLGPGRYFTGDPAAAGGYGTTVGEYSVKINNPLHIEKSELANSDATAVVEAIAKTLYEKTDYFMTRGQARTWARQQVEDFAGIGDEEFGDMLRSAGFDSVVLTDNGVIVEANVPLAVRRANVVYNQLDSAALQGPTGLSGPTTSVTDTPQFKRWFGDSKVVDGPGKTKQQAIDEAQSKVDFDQSRLEKLAASSPIRRVIERSLEKHLAELEAAKSGDGVPGKPLIVYHGGGPNIEAFRRSSGGRAIWFAEAGVANTYAGEVDGSTVYAVYLKAENPLVIDAEGATWQQLSFEGERVSTDDLASIAEERGFDGLIIKNLLDENTDDGGDIPATHYAVFNPTQIKSAIGNSGKFNPASASILQGPAGPAAKPADEVAAFMTDPVAQKYGLTILPMGTPVERADAKMMLSLYKKAEAWAAKNPMDDAWVKRANQLIDNSLIPAASTGLRLLKSKNPVARMMAAELLEDASGVAGKRRSTAALSKYLHERAFMGNALPAYNDAYSLWRNKQGGGEWSELAGRAYRDRFDRLIAEEIEYRRVSGKPVSNDPYVKAATDVLEAAYNRIRVAQQQNRTLGWQALPDTSVGYMPHKISPNKWLTLSPEQRQVVHQALTDQFINIEGWDMTFADQLASRYLERVQARATNVHDSPIGGASAGSAEIVEDALTAMGMSREDVRLQMQRFTRGAAGWTKGRLDLDLLKVYEVDGQEFRLLDVFETNQVELLRSQAGRASGEVALARHGIYGRPHMSVISRAMRQPAPGLRITDNEADAFDQVAAEFINAPFGTAEPKWLENARVLNSVVRLGMIVFNQFAEFVNGAFHVGAIRVINGVASMGRLRSEIKALVRGEEVKNPWLYSIERLGGAEFGTDAYRIVMPFDVPDHAYPTYGADTVTTFDRLVRGANYLHGKVSLWRTVHSVQQRAMAEQIVAKIGRYANDGGEDVALRQFGISPELQAAIKRDGVARYDNGSLVEFDVNKLQDPAQREELVQAVHRGVSQIIQGTFIGETGKWAHSGYLKMLVQFRTFSLTAMEKQWARQRNSRGGGPALAILLTSMMAVWPIYVARVYASSIGREDQEEFLEQRLQPEMIVRQTLNYVALSGLAGDFLDAAVALSPDEWGLQMTGGRAGTDTEFVGNLIAPATSLVDDAWKALQNLDDPAQLLRVLPGSRLPYIVPGINALQE